ncbi:MAG: DsbA family protein [Sphingomicrobium sp.]
MILKPSTGLALVLLALSVPAAAKKVAVPPDSASVAENRRYFTEDPDAPVIAPKGYDITVVEYVDYQCPYCRSSSAALDQLVKRDKKVRVLFRDWPIIAPESRLAAQVAIAAKYQGKYLAVHKALLAAPRPLDLARIQSAAVKAGADLPRLKADMKANFQDIDDLLERNEEQALLLGFTGTPGFIIGNFQSFGGATLADLEETVRMARAKAKGLPTTIRKSRAKK